MNNKYVLSASGINRGDLYFIVFSLKNLKYAVNIRYVSEIINIQELEIPETAPIGIIGLLNYSGEIIRAVDLCPFLGFETEPFTINSRFIILNNGKEHFCILADEIEKITSFEPDKIQKLPYSGAESILDGIYKSDEGSINIIDCGKLSAVISKNSGKKSIVKYAELFPSDEKSKQVLKLRAAHFTAPSEIFALQQNPSQTKQYILFTMSGQNFYLDIKYVKEFVSAKRLNIAKLPYAPDYVKGITCIKGEFMTIIDLNRFINPKSTEDNNDGRLIVVSGKNFNTAFLVKDIKYIRNLDNIRRNDVYSNGRKYIYAEFMEDGILYSILDFKQIINDERLYINIE